MEYMKNAKTIGKMPFSRQGNDKTKHLRKSLKEQKLKYAEPTLPLVVVQ